MQNLWDTFFGNRLPPHGHCYLWNDNLVFLHVTSDVLITVSYFTIPVALVYLVRKRDDLRFNYIFLMFGIFIFACGLTHLLNIYTVWYGAYWLSGTVKAITAIASVVTATLIWPLMPKILAIPSNARLRELNEKLYDESQLNLRQRQELEGLSSKLAVLVDERTAELQELERVRAQLERNNIELSRSNEALQQFCYVASHDLKEPLKTILSMGTMLKSASGDKLADKEQQMLEFMIDASSRMSSLIDALRSYTVLGANTEVAELTNLDELVGTLLADLSSKVEEVGAEIVVDPLGEALVIRPQFRQLMQNMISNAVKFSAGRPQPKVEIGRLANTSREELGIYVRDNGIGIPKEFHEKIFGVFERLHNRKDYEGTGIGLAICKKIADRHGGRIEVHSIEGEGTEFRVFLPRNVD